MKSAILCALMSLSMPAAANAACRPGRISYDEPAQRLDQGVQRVARRSGCFVEVDLPRYGVRRTAAIKGLFTLRDALVRMVRPAGLTVVADGRDAGYRLTPAETRHMVVSGRISPADNQREARIHRHAAAIDRQVDAAVGAGRLSSKKATELHRQVGRVQVEAGHAGRTQLALTTRQAAAFEARLTRIAAAVHQR